MDSPLNLGKCVDYAVSRLRDAGISDKFCRVEFADKTGGGFRYRDLTLKLGYAVNEGLGNVIMNIETPLPIERRPTAYRLQSLICTENHRVLAELNLARDRMQKLRQYVGKGRISNYDDIVKREAKNLPVAEYIFVQYPLKKAGVENPEKFDEAFWILGFRPVFKAFL